MTRTLYTTAGASPTGGNFADNLAGHINTLYDAMAAPVSSIGGTGDAITGTVDTEFIANGLSPGMRASYTQGAVNTGSVTLALNGGAAVAVNDAEGNALAAGALGSGLLVFVEYDGSAWRVLSPLSDAGATVQPRYHWSYTSSTTWTKPSGLSDDTLVTVVLVGAGGGGATPGGQCGGGGGAASIGLFRLGDLPSSVSVTVAVGGAAGSVGGDTSFGSLLTGFGGGRGVISYVGGNGGGLFATAGGSAGGSGTDGADAANILEGGGGGGSSATNGGNSVYGGGGGVYTGTAGVSIFAGDGGTNGVAGGIPGGGGGAGASGGRGQCDIYI